MEKLLKKGIAQGLWDFFSAVTSHKGLLCRLMLGLGIKRNPVGIKVCAGYRYMFVSNSDNLGATMDLKILTHFV